MAKPVPLKGKMFRAKFSGWSANKNDIHSAVVCLKKELHKCGVPYNGVLAHKIDKAFEDVMKDA